MSELFPDRLRAARKMRELDQVELGNKSGLLPTAISHFETGSRKPSFDNLRRLAQALDVTVDYLMGRSDESERSTVADQLYRDILNLTASNQTLAKDFLAMLASRQNAQEEKNHG